MQKITTEEAKQIKENYLIINQVNLIKSNSINFYDKINKDFNLLTYEKIILKDYYYLCFFKKSESQEYYYKLDLRYNIIISID